MQAGGIFTIMQAEGVCSNVQVGGICCYMQAAEIGTLMHIGLAGGICSKQEGFATICKWVGFAACMSALPNSRS